ncbi:OB-fold nucleic acid binding domain-containing protein [Dehalobacterium formicoaceticum]|uniref:OB-fold nucleic acid binding domain-containing protein n=1 Tax=Dehalobacterium formicoaceticum TaxID=51515 RepID=A0ABT1Y7Q2_9FIRM|nr:HD domain-containing protein [Dehalobacterium formicoaceticum]MCR6546912.1 OB-fold nucleic acid binding domain-containing protein [Dehalobacterium formicoaceticum]
MGINLLKAGDNVLEFFLLKSSVCRTSSNNKKYLDLTLVDKTGEVNGKYWDCKTEEVETFQAHQLVKVQGVVQEWQQRLQLKINKIRIALPEDNVSISDFIPTASEDPQAMYKVIWRFIHEMTNEDIKKIVAKMVKSKEEQLMFYPAAKENHHAIIGGLLYHIKTMLLAGEKLAEIYGGINKDLLYAGIILHDLSKTDEMKAGPIGLITEYTVEGQLLGHIIQGVREIDQTAKEVGADSEVSLLLQHMVLAHHYVPEYGSPKRPMIPEGELLHYLDMIDARMYDMGKVLANTAPGELSDRVWTLDNRKLYRAHLESKKESSPEE